jgi:hypothetical protein
MIEDKNGKNLYRSFKSGGYMTDEDKIWEILYIDKGVQKSILVEGYSDIVETNNWKNKNPTKQFVQIRLYDNKIADGGELTEKDYEMAFAPRYLDGQDFAKISDNINKEYLAKDRKSGVHDKFTKYWYNGGREKAMAKYGEDENEAWEESYEDFKEDFYKMAKGGMMADGGEVEGVDLFEDYDDQPQEVQVILANYDMEDNDYETLQNLKSELEPIGYTFDFGLDAEPYDLRKIGEKGKSEFYAKGGKVRWQDVYVGDNALVIAENKMGMVVKPYGRRFHLKFPDGSERTYSAEELEFFKDEEFAKGGNISGYKLKDIKGRLIEEGDMVKTKQAEGGLMSASEGEVGIVEKTKDAFNNDALLIRFRKTGKNYDTTILLNGKINEIVEKGKNSKSATSPTGKYVNKRDVLNLVVKNPNKNGIKKYLSINPKDFLDGLHEYAKGGKLTDDYTYIKRSEVEHVIYRDSNGKQQLDFKPKNGFWVSKKALVDAGMNETKAKFDKNEVANELIALSNKAWDTLSIQSGSEIYASDDLQENLADEYRKVGIDKIYGQLTQPERKKVSAVLTDENEHSLRNYLALRGYNGEAEFKNYAKMYDESFAKFGYRSNWNPKNVDLKLGSFAKGGEMTDGKLVQEIKMFDKNSYPKLETKGDKVRAIFDHFKKKGYSTDEINSALGNMKYADGGMISDGGKLPEDMGRYFIKTSKTKVVKMADLIPLRKRATGIANAEKNMKMAYDGEMDKRKPITIYKSQRKYRIMDGNSTYAVAKANGWENIWAEIVKNPNMKNGLKRTDDIFSRAKSIRKEGEAWKDALQRAKTMK